MMLYMIICDVVHGFIMDYNGVYVIIYDDLEHLCYEMTVCFSSRQT